MMKITMIILVWATLVIIVGGYSYRNFLVNERVAEENQRLNENKILGNKCIQRVHEHHASSDVDRKGAYGQFSYDVAYASEFDAITNCIIQYPMQDDKLTL